ncbi:MAG: DNA repair protein RadA [Bacteroidales bacterium]|nr:DNA repair protein RadA [Bacteroidales bacterium]
MGKTRSVFVCTSCGNETPKWIGRCPSCGQWNTFREETRFTGKPAGTRSLRNKMAEPLPLSEISPERLPRLDTRISELNRVLGGGLVKGSVVLIGGEPGIGKSTLALQVALAMKDSKVLYISGEESTEQIRMRADRLKTGNDHCYVLSEVMLENIFIHLDKLKPDVVIVDSVQTLQDDENESSSGSISQIRDCTARLLKFAKETATPVLLIGHITKDGSLAGPKILEHIVDTVLLFEGDQQYFFRILRAAKNRFGATTELGIFEMLHEGLREVKNPSEVLINTSNEELSGISIAATIDGIRPFLIEVQALVSTAAYGIPQRVSSGYDLRKLNMLLAVLERRAGFRLATRDVFLNLAGGLRVTDPAIDLAVIVAILSSSRDKPTGKKKCFSAEVGLSGEIRPVSRIESRIREAERLGFDEIMISAAHGRINLPEKKEIKLVKVRRLEEVLKHLFVSYP